MADDYSRCPDEVRDIRIDFLEVGQGDLSALIASLQKQIKNLEDQIKNWS